MGGILLQLGAVALARQEEEDLRRLHRLVEPLSDWFEPEQLNMQRALQAPAIKAVYKATQYSA